MKKLLFLMAASVLVAGIASAQSITLLCTPVGSSLGTYSLSSTAVNCPLFNTTTELPSGDQLTSVAVTGNDSFDNSLGATTVTFTYSSITTGFAGAGIAPNGCQNSGASNPCTDILSGYPGGSASNYPFGGTVTSGLAGFESASTGTWTLASLAITFTGAGASSVGNAGVEELVTYDYAPTGATPEPMSLMMVGGAEQDRPAMKPAREL